MCIAIPFIYTAAFSSKKKEAMNMLPRIASRVSSKGGKFSKKNRALFPTKYCKPTWYLSHPLGHR